MSEEELKFVDDKLFVYTPLPEYGEGISKVQLVMTKEIFQECYKKWIEQPQEKVEISEYDKTCAYLKELYDVRRELLRRPDQCITFRDLVERFDEMDEEYNHSPWNLLQIYSNALLLIKK